MPKYLFRSSLSPEGVQGVIAEGGTARCDAVREAVERVGGSLDAFYFAFGDDDAVSICDMPSNEAAAAFAMEVSTSGRVSVSTTVLLTPEEIDRTRELHSDWRPPGA